MKCSTLIPFTTLISLIGSTAVALSATHKVQTGDTLWRISVKHKVSVEAIQQANNLTNNTIEIGQLLTIPSQEELKSAVPQMIKPKLDALDKTHIVSKGETLWGIAKKYKTTVKHLKNNNQLSSGIIEIGQVLSVTEELLPEPVVPAETVIPKLIKPAFIQPTPAENPEKIEEDLPVKEKDKKSENIAPDTPQTIAEVKLEETPKLLIVEKPQLETTPKVVNDAMTPLPPVPGFQPTIEEPTIAKESLQPKGLEALGEKERGSVRQQIILDRNGMGPGIIDGYPGDFTKTSTALAEKHRPDISLGELSLVIEKEVPAAILHYINPTLPGTGKRPDFEQATTDQCLMMYQSALELLAERYHCSEKLLAKMNPQTDFTNLTVGEKIMTPNVAEFKIEDFMTPEGEAVTYRYIRNTRRATRVDVDYRNNRIMVWYNNGSEGSIDELLASFPVTTNIKKGPKTQRTISLFAPAPTYMRKKTGLDLKPGPNSPVGIVWAKLGDGFGIHGTSDGSGNGYNTSSGCIRLSNWDMAIFVKIVPSKTKVNFITEESITLMAEKNAVAATAAAADQ